MGRNNHNAGMHFVHYTKKVSDADAVAYIEGKEFKQLQNATKTKFDEVSRQYDNPCHLRLKDMNSKVHVNYYSDYYVYEFPMYHYKVLNAKNKHNKQLTLWVGYDLGGKSYETGETEPRGYYFYFTTRFDRNILGRKLLLFEVNKKSNTNMEHAVYLASLFGKEIVSAYYNKLEIDWEHPIFEKYGHMIGWMNMERVRCFRTIKNCTLEY